MQESCHKEAPVIAIVMPVFNCASWLERSLGSVCAQTMVDWQCVCVDDGSTDGSARILDDMCHRDSRFHVVHQSNHGVSVARNRALDWLDRQQSKARYLVFVDADDVWAPELLARTLSVFGEGAGQPLDAVVFDYIKVAAYVDGKAIPFAPHGKAYSLAQPLAWIIEKRALGTWQFVYRMNAVAGLRFDPDLSDNEDMVFILRFLARHPVCAHLEGALYAYCQSPNSVCRKSLSLSTFKSRFRAIEECWQAFSAASPVEKNILRHDLFPGLVHDYWKQIRKRIPDASVRTIAFRMAAQATLRCYRSHLIGFRGGAFRDKIRLLQLILGNRRLRGRRVVSETGVCPPEAQELNLISPQGGVSDTGLCPRLTIVLTVFNGERFLRDALESLQKQTFRDWVCVCVDDGSTDASSGILQDFAKRDHRFQVVHQRNLGPSLARQTGLEAVKTAYCYFMDADDLLHPSALAWFMAVAETTHADCVFGDSRSFTDHPDFSCLTAPSYERLKFMDFLQRVCRMAIPVTVWNKLYKTALLRRQGFPPWVGGGEDSVWWFRFCLGLRSSTLAHLCIPTYAYRQSPRSLFNHQDLSWVMSYTHAFTKIDEIVFSSWPDEAGGRNMLMRDLKQIYQAIMRNFVMTHAVDHDPALAFQLSSLFNTVLDPRVLVITRLNLRLRYRLLVGRHWTCLRLSVLTTAQKYRRSDL